MTSFPNVLVEYRKCCPAKKATWISPYENKSTNFWTTHWPKSGLCHTAWMSRIDVPRYKQRICHDSHRKHSGELPPHVGAKLLLNCHAHMNIQKLTCPKQSDAKQIYQTGQLDHHHWTIQSIREITILFEPTEKYTNIVGVLIQWVSHWSINLLVCPAPQNKYCEYYVS